MGSECPGYILVPLTSTLLVLLSQYRWLLFIFSSSSDEVNLGNDGPRSRKLARRQERTRPPPLHQGKTSHFSPTFMDPFPASVCMRVNPACGIPGCLEAKQVHISCQGNGPKPRDGAQKDTPTTRCPCEVYIQYLHMSRYTVAWDTYTSVGRLVIEPRPDSVSPRRRTTHQPPRSHITRYQHLRWGKQRRGGAHDPLSLTG